MDLALPFLGKNEIRSSKLHVKLAKSELKEKCMPQKRSAKTTRSCLCTKAVGLEAQEESWAEGMHHEGMVVSQNRLHPVDSGDETLVLSTSEKTCE